MTHITYSKVWLDHLLSGRTGGESQERKKTLSTRASYHQKMSTNLAQEIWDLHPKSQIPCILHRLVVHVPWSKVAILGMVIQPLIGNPYNGYINPYYWVDDHPLYGNNGSLDPSTHGEYLLFDTSVAILLLESRPNIMFRLCFPLKASLIYIQLSGLKSFQVLFGNTSLYTKSSGLIWFIGGGINHKRCLPPSGVPWFAMGWLAFFCATPHIWCKMLYCLPKWHVEHLQVISQKISGQQQALTLSA